MAKKILITGVSGFVGRHMASFLLSRGYETYGLDRGIAFDLPEGCKKLVIDLEDSASMADLPRDWFGVIHLAGASIPSLFATAAPVVSNLHSTLNLLEHLRSARVLLVSSCHVYGPSNGKRREDSALIPQGRYGLSKYLLEAAAPHYLDHLDIRIARPFNHLGPGQRPELVIPSLLRRLAEAAKGSTSPVLMEGQNGIRDFIDVRDVVEAYLAILEMDSPTHRTYNICTGNPHSIREVVQTVLDLVDSPREIVFAERPNSKDDIPFLVGDPLRLNSEGWVARLSLAESLSAMLMAKS